MTARNPEESPDEPKRDKVLQAINQAPNEPAEPTRQDTPALDAPQNAVLDTKVEPDRVALYLRGPTVFSA